MALVVPVAGPATLNDEPLAGPRELVAGDTSTVGPTRLDVKLPC